MSWRTAWRSPTLLFAWSASRRAAAARSWHRRPAHNLSGIPLHPGTSPEHNNANPMKDPGERAQKEPLGACVCKTSGLQRTPCLLEPCAEPENIIGRAPERSGGCLAGGDRVLHVRLHVDGRDALRRGDARRQHRRRGRACAQRRRRPDQAKYSTSGELLQPIPAGAGGRLQQRGQLHHVCRSGTSREAAGQQTSSSRPAETLQTTQVEPCHLQVAVAYLLMRKLENAYSLPRCYFQSFIDGDPVTPTPATSWNLSCCLTGGINNIRTMNHC